MLSLIGLIRGLVMLGAVLRIEELVCGSGAGPVHAGVRDYSEWAAAHAQDEYEHEAQGS